MTQFCRRLKSQIRFIIEKVLVKIYWDDQQNPGVLTPLGDFFCFGHSIPVRTILPVEQRLPSVFGAEKRLGLFALRMASSRYHH
ncbi:MAG: DUF2961 domain-containing protein [Terrimicrobiaceae bacterium]